MIIDLELVAGAFLPALRAKCGHFAGELRQFDLGLADHPMKISR